MPLGTNMDIVLVSLLPSLCDLRHRSVMLSCCRHHNCVWPCRMPGGVRILALDVPKWLRNVCLETEEGLIVKFQKPNWDWPGRGIVESLRFRGYLKPGEASRDYRRPVLAFVAYCHSSEPTPGFRVRGQQVQRVLPCLQSFSELSSEPAPETRLLQNQAWRGSLRGSLLGRFF